MDRVRSLRRLAKNARENVVYMYLSEKLTPDFRTISNFRSKGKIELSYNAQITVDKGVAFFYQATFVEISEKGMKDISYWGSRDNHRLQKSTNNRAIRWLNKTFSELSLSRRY